MNSTADDSYINLTIFTANVLRSYKNVAKLSTEINSHQASILILTETDHYWLEQLGKPLRKVFRYKVEVPKRNTYGILVYSKYLLIDPEVR